MAKSISADKRENEKKRLARRAEKQKNERRKKPNPNKRQLALEEYDCLC